MTTTRGSGNRLDHAGQPAARGFGVALRAGESNEPAEAGRFHARWTPRGWSDLAATGRIRTASLLAATGYGTSYITGKLQFERLMSDYAQQQQSAGKHFNLGEFFAHINEAGRFLSRSSRLRP